MNFVYIHLVLTHFPPVLSIECVAAAAAAQFVRSQRCELVRAALILMIVTCAMVPAIYFAGVRTYEVIGKVDGIQQEAIAPHQQAALVTLCVSVATILTAALLLIADRRQPGLSFSLRLAVLLLTLGLAATIGWTASRGGAIHHPEVSTAQ